MLELVLLVLVIILAYLYYTSLRKISSISSEKQSLSVKYGKMSEQFFPFLKKYNHDPQSFRFIGTPIDGIQFDDDKIIFVEFKSSSSQMTEKQKKIKSLVENGKVSFEEVRIK